MKLIFLVIFSLTLFLFQNVHALEEELTEPTPPDLWVGVDHGGKIYDTPAPVKFQLLNAGDGTAINIKLSLIDPDDAFLIKEIDVPKTNEMKSGEMVSYKYALTGKKLGTHMLLSELSWEDSKGNTYTQDMSPHELGYAIFLIDPELTREPPVTRFVTYLLLFGGVAAVGVTFFYYYKNYQKSKNAE